MPMDIQRIKCTEFNKYYLLLLLLLMLVHCPNSKNKANTRMPCYKYGNVMKEMQNWMIIKKANFWKVRKSCKEVAFTLPEE